MKIETSEARRLQHGRRQQQSVGDDDGGVGGVAGERRPIGIGLEIDRRQHGEASGLGKRLHGRFAVRHATAGGARRLRVDGDDLVPGADNFRQRRHGKRRRSHEDDAQGHGGTGQNWRGAGLAGSGCRPRLLLELAHHNVALQRRKEVDDQFTVEVIDLVLDGGGEQPLRI